MNGSSPDHNVSKADMTKLLPTTPNDELQLLKTPRRQRSTRFHVDKSVEIEKYPGFHGMMRYSLKVLIL